MIPIHMTRDSSHRAVIYGRNLARELQRQDVSIHELSRRLGDATSAETMRRSIHRYLKGKHMPSKSMRAAIARALNISPEQLYSEEDEEEAELRMRAESVESLLEDLLYDVRHRAGMRKVLT